MALTNKISKPTQVIITSTDWPTDFKVDMVVIFDDNYCNKWLHMAQISIISIILEIKYCSTMDATKSDRTMTVYEGAIKYNELVSLFLY